MPEDSRFVLAKEIGLGRIETIRGCDTEKEIRKLYMHLLIQSGFGSGYRPYQRLGDGENSYTPLLALAFEVEDEFKKKTERDQKEAELESRVM